MVIAYNCPIHGRIEPNEKRGLPPRVCPKKLERTVAGKVVRETCGEPLVAVLVA
jgi:hypothetical protein